MTDSSHHSERKAKYYHYYIAASAAPGNFIFLGGCFAIPIEKPFKEASASKVLTSRSSLLSEWKKCQSCTLVNS